MMPDLGKYAAEVLSSYAVSLALIFGVIWISLARSRRVKAELEDVESRRQKNG